MYRLSLVILSFFLLFCSGKELFAQQSPLSLRWPIELQASGHSATFSGKLDDKTYTAEQRGKFKLTLYYVQANPEGGVTPFVDALYENITAFNADPTAPNKKPGYKFEVASHRVTTGPVIQELVGPNLETGEYSFVIKNLTPASTYYYAHIAEYEGRIEVRAGQFDSSKGHMTQTEKESDFEKRSYRLLSPLPGLAVFLDPDLCLQLLSENKPVPSLCTEEDPSGFNTFLNYMFKLLIGLSATLLVLRIIFEGYQYVMTDVPFLKSSAKSKLWQSVLGLLLALSAYLILNTINPKLVTNKIEINSLTLTVEEHEDPQYTAANYQQISQQTNITNYECPEGIGTTKGVGVVNDSKIVNKVCPTLEGGTMQAKGITIHGTGGRNDANSIVKGWITSRLLWKKGVRTIVLSGKNVKVVPSSAHFIVDKNGTISQVVRTNKASNHCGGCTKQGSTNSSSISIEVVMACVKDCTGRQKPAVWDMPTSEQISATAYLVNFLLRENSLNKNTDIYTHGAEANNRTLTEGQNTLDAIKPYLK